MVWRAALALAIVAAAAAAITPHITQGEGEATFTIVPGSQNAPPSDTDITFTMKVTGVLDMGAWEFAFAYDPGVLTYAGVTPSGFLAQTGRTQQCPSPTIVKDVTIPEVGSGLTTVQYGCNTTGSSLAGVSGSGTLATVKFTPNASGVTPLVCTKMEITDAIGDVPQPTGQPCTAVIKVTSSGGDDGGSGDDGGGSSSDDTLEPTPTPNPRVLTPTPIPNAPTQAPQYTLGTPESGITNPDSGAPGTGSAAGSSDRPSASTGSGSSSGGSGSGGLIDRVRGAGEFPVAGYGMARDGFSRLSLWGQLLLLAGALTLGAGAALRLRRQR